MRITLLISGGLGLEVLQQLCTTEDIRYVFTDRGSVDIVETCRRHRIPVFIGNPRKGRAASIIGEARCDLLFSVNYLFLVEEDILALPTRYAINLHGSLLPKYRGRTPHVWAIINGETEVGVTAHLMTPELDAGAIVRQVAIDVPKEATGAEVLSRYREIYPKLVRQILSDVRQNMVHLTPQDESKATYFPKRTPDDGAIDWQWSRERVYNWIRAQAAPYPGAFFIFGGKRYIVHKASFSELGFRHETENGRVLSVGQDFLTVKLSNGALELGPLSQKELKNFTDRPVLQ